MNKLLLTLYLIIQTVLYVLSVYIDNNLPTNILEYLIIVANFLFAIYLVFNIKNKDSIITLFALFFTLIADTFLVLLSKHLTVAMISFSITQILYYIRIKRINNELMIIKKNDITRYLIIFVFLIIMLIITFKNLDSLILVTTFYFLMLLFNFIDSLKSFKKYPYFSIGLLLFLFCDIFVGLNFLKDSLPNIAIINTLLNLKLDLVWFFYAPSQVLLTLSIFFINENIRKQQTNYTTKNE